MTYKATNPILKKAQDAGLLVPFVPTLDADESLKREIWMPPPLHDWLFQRDGKKTLDYKANIRMFLKRFIIGDSIDNCVFMKNWTDNVWEFRVQLQPKRENTRIFGAFIEQDVFVALFQKLRSELGDIDNPKWKAATDRVAEGWATIFGSSHRLQSVPFSNCVSGKFYDDKAANGGSCL